MSNLHIMDKTPTTWKELQQFCSYILNDCGFEAVTEKKITTVRGVVEVDVYAEKKGAYNNRILCECKYWSSGVPQTIVHAFRTVIEDSGSSQGILIAKDGYQKGAHEAAKHANISLFTWQEFQDAFKMDYLNFVIERNFKKGHELRTKANVILEKYHKHPLTLSKKEFNEFQLLREAYSDLLFYTFREHYEDLDTKEILIEEVERGVRAGMEGLHVEFNSLKEYFDYIFHKCQNEIENLNSIMLLMEERLMLNMSHE